MPIKSKDVPQLTPRQIANFHAKVDMSGGPDKCWIWKGWVSQRWGYGIVSLNRQEHRAHRVAAAISGKKVKDKIVCHKCHNKLCCNPRHLKTGTHEDNMRHETLAGKHKDAKITYAKANAIRRMFAKGVSSKQIQKRYGITRKNVDWILRNKTYKNPNYTPIYRGAAPVKRTLIKGYKLRQLPSGRWNSTLCKNGKEQWTGTYDTQYEAEQAALRKILPSFLI